MKKFTKEHIDDWRNRFVQREYLQRTAHLDCRVVDYFVMPAALFRGIPNGLFRMTGEARDGYLVGVSDEVPSGIQDAFAVSEHDEFMVYGLDDLDRTLHSEQNMLRILRRDSVIRPVYICAKLALYRHLLEQARGNLETWNFTEEDYVGFERAATFLHSEL